ncbi:hypothetical protein ACFCZV_00170 [Streptomyces hydrogenans]|uniref:hypothetical protein n=1 Tax=Streptomyces hydrogenans TaxID=1873719 RepID=UPI0035E0EF8F
MNKLALGAAGLALVAAVATGGYAYLQQDDDVHVEALCNPTQSDAAEAARAQNLALVDVVTKGRHIAKGDDAGVQTFKVRTLAVYKGTLPAEAEIGLPGVAAARQPLRSVRPRTGGRRMARPLRPARSGRKDTGGGRRTLEDGDRQAVRRGPLLRHHLGAVTEDHSSPTRSLADVLTAYGVQHQTDEQDGGLVLSLLEIEIVLTPVRRPLPQGVLDRWIEVYVGPSPHHFRQSVHPRGHRQERDRPHRKRPSPRVRGAARDRTGLALEECDSSQAPPPRVRGADR